MKGSNFLLLLVPCISTKLDVGVLLKVRKENKDPIEEIEAFKKEIVEEQSLDIIRRLKK